MSPPPSLESLREQVQKLTWVHCIDLGNGLVTPGMWQPNPLILKAFDETDFHGKKVLDIGCWDGLWAFEAEKRGAREVVAIDDISQRWNQEQQTFTLAHRALNSKVRYNPRVNVFSLAELLNEHDFDIVLFLGVYYHLKNPLLALAHIREVLKTGGLMLVEGDVITNTDENFARFYYRERYKRDKSNWWVPTVPCLRDWIECSFFSILREYGKTPNAATTPWARLKRAIKRFFWINDQGLERYVVVAEAVKRKDPNYCLPDSDLAAFDLNDYQ